jgi:hypothetical protein
MLWQFVNFLFDIILSSDFLQGNYKNITLKFVVLSIALATSDAILSVVREITLIERYEKV